MSQLLISNIKGLTPLLDRKKLPEPYIVDGANFAMEADGPVSSFGRTLLSYKAILNPKNIQKFDVSSELESLIFTNEGVYILDTETDNLFLMYKLNYPVTSSYPWTMASVGNQHYFARKGYSLLQYTVQTDTWAEITDGIPEEIYSCTEAEGRLVLLTKLFVAWSAIGVGSDFNPSATTGAGAQVLTKMGLSNPIPISVKKIPDGFITFLSSGIMRSQAIQSQNPFRHRVLSYERIPVNPYAITKTAEDTLVFMSAEGLFSTNGQTITPWQPVMGEYFRTKILPRFDFKRNQNSIQLHVDVDRAWFLIYISENQKDFLYSKAFILNLKTEQWGSFDDPFVYLTDIEARNARTAGFNFNLITVDGSIYKLDNAPGIQKIPTLHEGIFYANERADMRARKAAEITFFPFEMQMDFISYGNINKTGIYNRFFEKSAYISPVLSFIPEKPAYLDTTTVHFPLSSETNLSLRELSLSIMPPVFKPLDAFVRVGLIRLMDETDTTRYSYITKASISMLPSAVGDTFVDWMDETQFPGFILDDWESYDGHEDWGVGSVDSVQYGFNVLASLDGYDNIKDYMPSTELITIDGRTRFYAVNTMALYHTLEITAYENGDNFDLKLIDISTLFGGML